MIDYDSIKYINLNTSVLIIKKLGKFNDFLNFKKNNFKNLKIVKVDIQRLYSCVSSNNEVEYFIPQSNQFILLYKCFKSYF